MRPSRILFVLEYYYPHIGGVETQFAALAESLVKHGHEVTVITAQVPGSIACEIHEGVQIVRVATPACASRYGFTILALPTVLRHAAWADLIHTTTYNAAPPAWLAALCCNRPCILTVNEVFADQWYRLPDVHPLLSAGFRYFEGLLLQLPFAHYICISGFTQARLAQYARVPSQRCSVVYPAVDYTFWDPRQHRARPLRQELGLPEDTSLYLYFGRPGISKGVECLIEAAGEVRRQIPSSRLVLLLGTYPASGYRRIQRAIQSLGLADHVITLEPVRRTELPGYLLASNCVVVPSISEGFGYSAVEAASIGCSVVATTGHAVQEVLRDDAHFVPPSSSARLAEAIIQVLNTQPEHRPAPAQYHLLRHVQGVMQVYAQCLDSRESPVPETAHPNRGIQHET